MSLQEPVLTPISLTSITPKGWLEKQLQIQVDGLSGHLDEFWPDIQDSAWIGGKAEGWERMPYWLDGAIPLAWLANHKPLKKRITGYMDYIISHQEPDGWLGPRGDLADDIWSQFLALKVLVVYHDATGDERVQSVVEKALRSLDGHIGGRPLFQWGQFRWFEALIAVYWLYERTQAPWLKDLAVKLHAQGFNWREFFARWPLEEMTPKGHWNHAGHVVNNAMAIKAHGLWWRLTGAIGDKTAVYDMIEKLDRYHGMITGVFTGDECLAGTSPSQGTELCAVVEYMYSLEILLSLWGDPVMADRLEMMTFNALPATFSPDMWGHQYDQQVNQVECSTQEKYIWTTNGPESNLFGLEPNFGCCTANLSQGWPKFAAHLWMKTDDGGLAAVAYAPSQVTTDIAGTSVSVALETDYPFRDVLKFTVSTDKPTQFPLHLRIPGWAQGASVEVNGETTVLDGSEGFYRINREWEGETVVVLTIPMKPELVRRPNDAGAIVRGPLVYSLKIGEDWRQVNKDEPHRELPHGDWEVYATTPWNYGLAVSEENVATNVVFEEQPIGDSVFSPDGAPITGKVKARQIGDWKAVNGSAEPVPTKPTPTGKEETVTLIPYGCTNLRVTEFPVL